MVQQIDLLIVTDLPAVSSVAQIGSSNEQPLGRIFTDLIENGPVVAVFFITLDTFLVMVSKS